MSKPKVYYFDGYGRVESIRLLFSYTKTDFEDVRLSHEEFGKKKATGFFFNGQVPCIEVDGKKMYQSIAMLRYFGQKANLYPSDPEEAYRVEAAIAYKNDILPKIYTWLFNPDKEAWVAGQLNFFQNDLPPMLKLLERFYLQNSAKGAPFMSGKSLSIADIAMVDIYTNLTSNDLHKELALKAFATVPDFQKYCQIRAADFKDYLEKRPKAMF